MIIISSHLADNAPESAWMTLLTLFSVPLGIIAAVCSVLYALRLAEAFGKGKIFGVGLFLVYSVFVSIIGFGKSKYIEIRENDADEAAAEDSQDIGVVV